jgi:uncharacterized protein DUF6894
VPQYFFDTWDDDTFIKDDIGLVVGGIEEAKGVANLSLAELARDVLPAAVRRVLKVQVRKGEQRVLESRLTFEAVLLAPELG